MLSLENCTAEGQLGNKQRAQQFNLLGEKRKSEGIQGEGKKTKRRREAKEKRRGWEEV